MQNESNSPNATPSDKDKLNVTYGQPKQQFTKKGKKYKQMIQ